MVIYRRLQTFIAIALLLICGTSIVSAQDDVGTWAIESISPSRGQPGERVRLDTNASQLVCRIYDTRGIDTVSEFLGLTSDGGVLEFTVPDWDPGTYGISCAATSPPGGGSVIGSTNNVNFTIAVQPGQSQQAQLPQPQDYFGPNWSPPWLEPLSRHFGQVSSTNQRVSRTTTISVGNVDLQLRLEAANSAQFNAYVSTAEVFFEVLSSATNFRVSRDNLSTSQGCPLPALMANDRAGRVLPDPPLDNRLRAQARINGEVVGAIRPGEEFFVLDGPVCADGVHWWYVQSGAGTGWTAEGRGEYYTETYPEIDVEISVTGSYPSAQTNVLYFYVDPQIGPSEIHRYRSRDEFSASARARVTTGAIALAMFRTSPSGYFRGVSASANSYTSWLSDNAEPDSARYSATVRGVGERSNYFLQGTFELQ
ncbi:MAG: hypothetical protein IPK19_35010 [Chloroflexi bacterium]|nr:hypothetical protein [Chloroflexota bacterium]